VTFTLIDFFCGAGGSSQGAVAVPGVSARLAANHWSRAIESHEANFPATEHYQGDLHAADLAGFPAGDIFWASPECPQWSVARGRRREFDRQPDLFGEVLGDEAADRSRALMWDVPRYLEAMQLRGRPVLAGVMENVTEVRAWAHWHAWVAAIRNLGYRTRLIALNSMHARPAITPHAPQSRDRLYLAYWLASLGRDPDWDRRLRPPAWCPGCEQQVQAVQWWKRPGADMGRYRAQYLYRCPHHACRGQVVEPAVLPAAAAIDWALPGTRIGDRAVPLKPKTIARIEAGLRKYAIPVSVHTGRPDGHPGSHTRPVSEPPATCTATPARALAGAPLMVPAGGTRRDEATPVTDPMPARTARENDGLAVPPFVTIHRGGPGETRTAPVTGPLPAVVAGGNHHGLAVPPFLVPLRSGRPRAIPVTGPAATVVADGSNHALVTPPLLVPAEGRDGKDALPVTGPARTQTARAETGLAVPPFLAVLRRYSDTTAITGPLRCVTADGNHHALITPADLAMVMRNNTPRGDPGQMCTPATQPLRALTTTGHQSLLTWAHLLVPYYRTGVARPVSEPAGTVSATDRFALASPAVDVNDVLFRMLEPHEIAAAMAFTPGYVVLGSKRERVRQLGNAVTPPVAEILITALVEAITGEPIEPAA
jgi:DNA (cytosine-5)-methyltransferase 1